MAQWQWWSYIFVGSGAVLLLHATYPAFRTAAAMIMRSYNRKLWLGGKRKAA